MHLPRQANVDYATEKLAAFKESSQWYDPLAFCEPVFLVGNGLLMSPGIPLPLENLQSKKVSYSRSRAVRSCVLWSCLSLRTREPDEEPAEGWRCIGVSS